MTKNQSNIVSPAQSKQFWDNFAANPFHAYLGMSVVSYRYNYAKLALKRTETTPTGIGGSVNGGVLATLVDMTAVAAVFAELRDNEQPAGTADLQITYLRQTKGEVVTSEAQVLKRGRQLATIDVKVHDNSDNLCCIAKVLYAFRATP